MKCKSDADDINLVTQLLTKIGLSIEDVPEGKTKTCDLRAQENETLRYLIEVKAFFEDEAIDASLKGGDIYSKLRRFSSGNSVAKAISEAVKQLEATARVSADEMRILVLRARNKYDDKVVFQQCLAELCGKRSIIDATDVADKRAHLECFYFSHSAFFRHRKTLDGAMIIDSMGAVFVVNEFGTLVERVRQSKLARFFEQHDAIMTQTTLERDGFLIADCDIDRNDEPAVLRYVAQKYNLRKPSVMDFKRYSAIAMVDQRGMRKIDDGDSHQDGDVDSH